MTIRKRLIEYNLPLADTSEASAHEKNVQHGYISNVSIWWARRPLAPYRAKIDMGGSNFMVPIPRVASFNELNAHLLNSCRKDDTVLRVGYNATQ